MSKANLKIWIFGGTPPPIGGVTVSVKNLMASLNKVQRNIVVQKFPPVSLKTFFLRSDFLHIHYSRVWKRFLAVILGKIFSKYVIFTVHGSELELGFFNKYSFILADGVIFLNESAANAYQKLGWVTRSTIQPSIYSEGLDLNENFPDSVALPKKCKKILLYASYQKKINGKDLYGIDFVMNLISVLNEKNIKIIFLDPTGAYRNNKLPSSVFHICQYTNTQKILLDIDLYIRPTLVDGDSVLIREAIALGCPVLASDSVPRDKSVNVYKCWDTQDFLDKVDYVLAKKNKSIGSPLTSINEYLDFLNQISKSNK